MASEGLLLNLLSNAPSLGVARDTHWQIELVGSRRQSRLLFGLLWLLPSIRSRSLCFQRSRRKIQDARDQ